MRKEGWFAIPGVQHGARSLEEQMRGLGAALIEAKGRTVCDLGCAEGLIAIEFAKAGGDVWACDFNGPMIERAEALAAMLPPDVRPSFEVRELLALVAEDRRDAELNGVLRPLVRFDIVLALAIVHKLDDPRVGAEYVADICGGLAVFRLPLGSDGTVLRGKHSGVACNLHTVMGARGFVLERVERGPRREAVHYWRRRPG